MPLRCPRRRTGRTLARVVLIVLVASPLPLALAITGTGSDSQSTGGEEPQRRQAATGADALVPLSVGPGGEPGSGKTSDPVVAPYNPDVVVFVSDDDHLDPDDGNGRPDVFVNDGGDITRVSGKEPGAEHRGVVSTPSVSGSGDVIVYVHEVLPDGDSTPRREVVVTDRKTSGTERVPPPVGVDGTPADPRISADGTVLVWEQQGDLYCYRRGSGAAEPDLVTRDITGQPAGGTSTSAISDDGRFVAFASESPLIVPDDSNGVSDVFLRTGVCTPDPADDQAVQISRSPTGGPADGPSFHPTISGDGGRIAYETFATNVVPPDDNGTADVVVHDVAPGTTRVAVRGNGPSGEPSISKDGRYVGVTSAAGDLVPGDTNGADATGATPTHFQVFDRSGTLTYGTSILAVDGPRVRVGFPAGVDLAAATGGSVDGAALIDGQVVPLANRDRRSNTNPLGTRAVAVPGRPPATDLTDGPDLVSAEVVADDNGTPDDSGDDGRAVRYCFDEAVETVTGGAVPDREQERGSARFMLQGYNSLARQVSSRAAIEPTGDPDVPRRCVRARFDPDVDVARFTAAAALAGAVADRDGRANLNASQPLQGNGVKPRAGDVTGPNLIFARPDLATNRAVFTFDHIRELGATTGEPASRFAFLDADGRVHVAASIVSLDHRTSIVTVAFAADTDPVATARRFVVLPDAVRNAAGEPNVEQATDANVVGPELVSAKRVGDQGALFDFTFSSDVLAPDSGKFFLYTEDGTAFQALSVSQPAGSVVRVAAPAVEPIADAIVLGVAQAGAVFERLVEPDSGEARRGAPNTIGVRAVGRLAAAAGALSDGPDLVAVEVVPGADAVDYVFDEPVRDVRLVPPRPRLRPLPTDVFVHDLVLGATKRVSLDEAGRQVDGSSSAPGMSADGRFIVFRFPFPFAGLKTATPAPQIVRRDLVMVEVRPGDVDFGQVVAGIAPGTMREIAVANRGCGPLVVRAVRLADAEPGTFRLRRDGCSGRTLGPEETCSVTVTFEPDAPGHSTGRVVIADTGRGSPRSVPVAGVAAPTWSPLVAVSPGLAPPGAVALVRGEQFPPQTRVEVRWTKNPATPGAADPITGVTVVTTDAHGRFAGAPLLVFPHDALGPRRVEARAVDRPEVFANAAFLVVPSTFQPSGGGMFSVFRAQLFNRR